MASPIYGHVGFWVMALGDCGGVTGAPQAHVLPSSSALSTISSFIQGYLIPRCYHTTQLPKPSQNLYRNRSSSHIFAYLSMTTSEKTTAWKGSTTLYGYEVTAITECSSGQIGLGYFFPASMASPFLHAIIFMRGAETISFDSILNDGFFTMNVHTSSHKRYVRRLP
jgi:hypothetical protein